MAYGVLRIEIRTTEHAIQHWKSDSLRYDDLFQHSISFYVRSHSMPG
jgi:hypothetical protein